MFEILCIERAPALARLDESIKKPLIAVDANFEQHAVVSSVPLNMKPSLLFVAAPVRAEDCFNCEGLQTGDWIRWHQQRIVNTVKQDCFAAGRIDHPGITDHSGRLTANFVEPVDLPQHWVHGLARWLTAWREHGERQREHDGSCSK